MTSQKANFSSQKQYSCIVLYLLQWGRVKHDGYALQWARVKHDEHMLQWGRVKHDDAYYRGQGEA